MGNFTAFRGRILATLAAAGVAQGCGGIVNESQGDVPGDGGMSVTAKPGCKVDRTLEDRIAAIQNSCGAYCTPSPNTTECFTRAELAGKRLPCGAPIVDGVCPASTDLIEDYCSVIVGGAAPAGGSCCYQVMRLSCAVPGRPLRVNGTVCLPEVVSGDALPFMEEPDLDANARAVLAELWCEGGRFEHASVAAFARTTMQLMALGAPAELIAASQQASLDELEHARLCFALASRFAGRALRPGRLPVDATHYEKVGLADLAAEMVVGGCVGETVAALTAVEQLERATDREVRAALERIAEDEANHAELAWRIVVWAWGEGGSSVRAEIAAAFESELERREESTVRSMARATESHGHLSPWKERAIRQRILTEVVGPCARVVMAA